MSDANVFGTPTGEAKRKNPRIEDFKYTFKLFFKNKLAFVGFAITVVYFIIALMDFVYPHYLGAKVTDISNIFVFGQVTGALPTAPTFAHGWWYIFGTTQYRVAIFPTLLAALKVDLSYSLVIVLIGAVLGVIVGSIAGYFGGIVDEIMMRVTDVFFGVPFIIMAIAFTVVLKATLSQPVVIALIIIWWPIYARLSRSLALSTKSQKYVEAAVASGSSGLRNVFSHVMPNVLSPVFVQISLDLGSIVQILAALDFIGFHAVGPLTPEIGNLLTIGQVYFSTVGTVSGLWWPLVLPGVFLLIFTVAVNLMGDGLRDVLDPKLRR